MSHLSRFPTIEYPYPGSQSETVKLRDVTFAINFLRNRIKDEYVKTYELTDGERPEIAAYNLYGNPEYAWILLILNDAIDPFFDWFLSEDQVKRLTEDRYGSLEETHHYENDDGDWVDGEESSHRAIRNIDYEIEENEKKRKIIAIKPRYIQKVISQLESSVDT